MKYFSIILNLIFLTLTMYFCVTVFYKYVNDGWGMPLDKSRNVLVSPTDLDVSSRSAGGRKSGFLPRAEYDLIIKRNMFRIEEMEDAKKELSSEPDINLDTLEKTALNLTLWGTVTGRNKENFAVIEGEKNKEQLLYKKGDSLDEGAIVKKILRRKVVLHYRGRDQVLEMEEKTLNSVETSSGKKPAPVKVSERLEIKRSLIDESMSNINNLMKQVRVRPHFTSGKADGLLLYGIKPDSLFRKMGIKNGDILLGVDGNGITSVDDALDFYKNLKTQSDIKLQIKRRGRIEEIEYHVED